LNDRIKGFGCRGGSYNNFASQIEKRLTPARTSANGALDLPASFASRSWAAREKVKSFSSFAAVGVVSAKGSGKGKEDFDA
jgi:hypothetical protein